ncbi:hypothetical protein ND860_17930 [Leptospira levettii]|uniref:hypothetical protein n=1 Tax=Leptospira levettii TaxID=2023178 RepID=UPI00223E7693|nr:hypothetical protein [Leptospira levettii]MCW7498421.1 hypothetical protein [Leptospira levettii]
MKKTPELKAAIKELDQLVSKSNFKNYKKVLISFSLDTTLNRLEKRKVLEDSLKFALYEYETQMCSELFENNESNPHEPMFYIPRIVFRSENSNFLCGEPFISTMVYLPEASLNFFQSIFESKVEILLLMYYPKHKAKVKVEFAIVKGKFSQEFEESRVIFDTSIQRTSLMRNASKLQFSNFKKLSVINSLNIGKKLHEALDQSIKILENGFKIEISSKIRKKIENLKIEFKYSA